MHSLKQFATASVLALAIGAVAQPAHAAATFFFNNTSYLSAADVPAGFYAGGAPLLLDDLEDNSLDSSLLGSAGSIIGPGQFDGIRDSVDADDGSIDGTGGAGHSWFRSSGGIGVTFTFTGATLPTAFAVVWTDGGGVITFSAEDGNGISLGSIVQSGFADASSSGTTGEDRFFGVTSAAGIKSILIKNSSGGIEVDHIQYGEMASPVPVPAAGWLLLSAAGLLVRRCRAS